KKWNKSWREQKKLLTGIGLLMEGICRYTQTMEPPQFIPSRELARHGGRPAYRAHDADSQAWESALRTRGSLPEDPAQCVAATSSRVAKLPAEVLRCRSTSYDPRTGTRPRTTHAVDRQR